MAAKNQFVEYLLDQLHDFGPVRARAMFGGFGVYRDDLMFGLVADDVLYLKTDRETKAVFVDAGSTPFVYEANGRTMEMSYYQCPDGALEDPAELERWATLAFDAARRNFKPKKTTKPKATARKTGAATMRKSEERRR